MRYYVTLEGRTFEVDLEGGEATVDGERVEARLARIPGTPVRHLLENDRSHAVVADRVDRERWDLHLDGQRLMAEVVDERTRAIRAMTGQTGAAAGPKPVKAPMPGLVVRIMVEPGQSVKAGESVAIIEAMKMENDLKAENAGVVGRVLVEAGQAVEKGAVLVELNAESPEEQGG